MFLYAANAGTRLERYNLNGGGELMEGFKG